jgi:DNA-binding CsgD family transcriptional regulator
MSEFIDRKSKIWAGIAATAGLGLFLSLELIEEPNMSAVELALEVLDLLPVVLTSVGVVLLFQVTQRQREEHLTVIRDLEVARLQGQRWRTEARTYLNGLGEAIDVQFSRWNLTEAEREVALLLLKGLSLKEVATVRATNERTVRSQARALYAKAGLSGRAALSAFFLEDLLAPIEGVSTPDTPADVDRPAGRPRTIQ